MYREGTRCSSGCAGVLVKWSDADTLGKSLSEQAIIKLCRERRDQSDMWLIIWRRPFHSVVFVASFAVLCVCERAAAERQFHNTAVSSDGKS